MPLEVVKAFSNGLCDYLAERSEPVWQGKRVFIIDGTTITLLPTAELKPFLRTPISTANRCGPWRCRWSQANWLPVAC